MSDDSERIKKGLRKMEHWFKAIEHESKMLDFPEDKEALVESWIEESQKLTEEYRTIAYKFLVQARISLQNDDDSQFRIWILRAKKIFEGANIDDLARAGPLKRKGGTNSAAIKKAEAFERAQVAAKHYDSLTAIEPHNRAETIAKRMGVSATAVRRYLKKTNRH